jgi:uncharacterized protein involved in outer membrane biogenesis
VNPVVTHDDRELTEVRREPILERTVTQQPKSGRAAARGITAPRRVAALAVVVLSAAIAAVAFIGASVDVSRWRGPLAERLSAALGRPVRLDGALRLELGLTAALRAAEVRVLNPPGFAEAELATLAAAEVRVDLLAALRGRWHVRSVELADGRIRLARAADGRANWAGRPQPAASGTPGVIEVDRFSIRNLAVEYQREPAAPRSLVELEELAGTGERNDPMRVTLRGRVRTVPCAVSLEGAPARLLQEADDPWPFTLDLECASTRLRTRGVLEPGRGTARFGFGVGTGDLREVERLLAEDLPPLGVAALTGNVVATAESIDVTDLHGVFGDTQLAGTLALELDGARARLAGELAIETLDLRPFLGADDGRRRNPLTYDELAAQRLPLHGPLPVDVELALRARHVLGLPGEIRDARLAVVADERGVRAPLAATVAGVPIEGRLDLELAAATPALVLEVRGRNAPLAGVAALLPGATGIDGALGRFSLRLAGRGETVGALIDDLQLRLEATDARLRYGAYAGGRPVDLTLAALELTIPRGQSLRGTARGALLAEPVRLALRAGTLPQMLRERATPIELELVAPGGTARFSGRLAAPGPARGIELAFWLDAPRAGGLARWLGVAPESTLPVALRGRAHIHRDQWRLEDATLKLGRSELAIDAERAVIDGKPIAVAAVRSPLIDLPELQTLRPRRAPARRPSAWLDLPVLPQGIDLADADIGLGLERVALGRVDLVGVGFAARIRDGRVPPSPGAAQLAGVPFAGLASLDLRGDVPEVSLSLAAEEVDVGALLRTLGVAEIIDERAATLRVELAGRGSDVRELLEGASLKARLAGGDLTVLAPAARPVAKLRLDEVVVETLPGGPVTARLEGAVGGAPATITAATGTLADFAGGVQRVPFTLEARAAGTRLALHGAAALPLGRGGEITLEMGGERLDSLSELVRVELPPWGPWSISGPIGLTPGGYAVNELTVRVGSSRLYGSGRLDLAGERPRAEVRVDAPHVQLDDFPYEVRPSPGTAAKLRARAQEAADQTEVLLSKAFLARFDAIVDVQVQQVLSGADPLGDGTLRAELNGGRLYVDPLRVNVPGGSVNLYAYYDTSGREVELSAGARIERFEYGILARRIRPDAEIAGLFSLDMALKSTAPSLSLVMAHADGHIDFAAWPRNLPGGVFDRWSVNVFYKLLPLLDPLTLLPFRDAGTESRVNCLVARLDLNGGVLTHDALVIDTTRVRAVGAGSADFRTEEIAFRFRPRAKGVTFFSLQTPLSVSGTMTDVQIAPTRGDLLEAFARLLASVILVPLEVLVHGPLPQDGADVCTDPLRSRE